MSKIILFDSYSSAGAEAETATSKNKALADAGALVPKSFDDFGKKYVKLPAKFFFEKKSENWIFYRIGELYQDLVHKGIIVPQPEVPPPPVPMDYAWAREVKTKGSFINHVDSWGGGGLAKLPFYKISLIK